MEDYSPIINRLYDEVIKLKRQGKHPNYIAKATGIKYLVIIRYWIKKYYRKHKNLLKQSKPQKSMPLK